MKVNIKYFGMLAEVTGCNQEIVQLSDTSVSGLRGTLLAKYPKLKDKNFKIAQNQIIISEMIKLTGEEIALLPPFSGG